MDKRQFLGGLCIGMALGFFALSLFFFIIAVITRS
jgi:hypothetical protein